MWRYDRHIHIKIMKLARFNTTAFRNQHFDNHSCELYVFSYLLPAYSRLGTLTSWRMMAALIPIVTGRKLRMEGHQQHVKCISRFKGVELSVGSKDVIFSNCSPLWRSNVRTFAEAVTSWFLGCRMVGPKQPHASNRAPPVCKQVFKNGREINKPYQIVTPWPWND